VFRIIYDNLIYVERRLFSGRLHTLKEIQYDPCINVQVGAWILSQAIADSDHYWQGVGNYHSHTLTFNQRYQQQVRAQLTRLNRDLRNNGSS